MMLAAEYVLCPAKPSKRAEWPEPTKTQIKAAMESLRALWRRTKTTVQLDTAVYNELNSAYQMLAVGRTEDASYHVEEALELLTEGL
jgi:hypothetical protein